MSTVISPVRPPSPKLEELAKLAQVGNAFVNAAQNTTFSDKERAKFSQFAVAYFGWMLKESPTERSNSPQVF